MNDLKNSFLSLMDEHQGVAHHICSLYTDNKDDHDDLFQEILLQLWKSFKSFKQQSKFSTWLYRVALNTAISHLRKKSKLKFAALGEAQHLAIDPVDNLDEEIRHLYQAIRKLSKIDRAITLLYLEENSYEEMAEILGITSVNVGVRLNRIKVRLKKIMEN